MKFYKYHGAGNDFLLADNRDGSIALTGNDIRSLCNRHTGFGADGVMLLEQPGAPSPDSFSPYDFRMEYFNSDGSGGMMCGNGGRCIVAFAKDLGVISTDGRACRFMAPDGVHTAELLENGNPAIVRLKMKDVSCVSELSEDEYFLDTGTRHVVRFVDDVENYDVIGEGRALRQDERFAPVGANANFVSVADNVLKVRTFEKGVEDETLACGTGITAAAIAAYIHGLRPSFKDRVENARGLCYRIKSRIAALEVEFSPEADGSFKDVWLTGPAERVGTIETGL